MKHIRRWFRALRLEHGSQGLEAAAAALAAALILASLLRVADVGTGARITDAMSCAASVLTGGGGCASGDTTTSGDDDDGGGFWSDLWDGITSTASDLWDGFTSFLSDAWNGFTSFLSGLWNGFTSFLSDVWNGIVSAAKWIWNGIVNVLNWIKDALIWLRDLIIPKSRPLTPEEIEAAKRVLGEDALDWERVRVVSGGWLDLVFKANGGRPFTLGYTIYVPDGDTISTETMVHELVHTYQYEVHGWDYVFESLNEQRKHGSDAYDYGGPEGLRKAWADGKHFSDFNVEQQAQIASDYYRRLMNGEDVSAYEPYIKELQEGKL